ncbi:MAG: META domain-containing protein [Ignavibacteria bacterium]|nr:META domain-containing protein [Ignavibacteria bacterium]
MITPALAPHFLSVLVSLIFISCSERDGSVPPLTQDELKNAEYSGLSFGSRTVRLTDGVWEGDPYVAGGSSRDRVVLVDGFTTRADFDTSGSEEAVVFLTQNSGGSGDFVYMSVVERKNGKPYNRGTVMVGDRVQIRDIRIDGWSIYLDLVEIGPDDAGCCPGQLITKSWDVLPGGLFPTPFEVTGRLSLEEIGGREWRLERWGLREELSDTLQITLVYSAGGFSGRSGCSRYTASVTEGYQPGDMTVGTATSTRMACPEDLMTSENRFLAGLQSATKFGFFCGLLAITTMEEGAITTYLFSSGTSDE